MGKCAMFPSEVLGILGIKIYKANNSGGVVSQ